MSIEEQLNSALRELAEVHRKVTLLGEPRPTWLTIEQAAAYMSISTAALRQRLKRDDRLPRHLGLGERSVRFRAEELDAYVQAEGVLRHV